MCGTTHGGQFFYRFHECTHKRKNWHARPLIVVFFFLFVDMYIKSAEGTPRIKNKVYIVCVFFLVVPEGKSHIHIDNAIHIHYIIVLPWLK